MKLGDIWDEVEARQNAAALCNREKKKHAGWESLSIIAGYCIMHNTASRGSWRHRGDAVYGEMRHVSRIGHKRLRPAGAQKHPANP